MMGLLVSVRNAVEAQAAIEGGADLIDIKEPNAGSLGPASVETWREVANAVANARPISAALGELLSDPVPDLAQHATGMLYAKIGLAGCRTSSLWREDWHQALSCIPAGVASVAVVYADYQLANAPRPSDILQSAIDFGCDAMLVDTYTKSNGTLFDCLDEDEMSRLVAEARQANLKVVLGGSLRGKAVLRAMDLAPDFIAVRGAVCRGDRRSTVEATLVAALANVVHSKPAPLL